MSTRNLIILVVAAALAACGAFSGGGRSTTIVQAPAPPLPLFDPQHSPRDDFYQWVNGPWMGRIILPSELGGYSPFVAVAETIEARLFQIIVEIAEVENHPVGSDQAKIRALFIQFLDRVPVQLRGAGYLITDQAALWRLEKPEQLPWLIGRRLAQGLSAPLQFRVRADPGGSGGNLLVWSQSGLGLPDRRYYLDAAGRQQERDGIRAAYISYIGEVFRLLGRQRPQERALAVFAIESALAAAQWDSLDSRDSVKTFNPFDRDGLAALAPGLDWSGLFAAIGAEEVPNVVVNQPSFVVALADLGAAHSPEAWSDYFLFHLANDLIDVLPDVFSAARFEVFGRQLRGMEIRQRPEDRVIKFMNRTMGPALGRIYLDKYFSAADRIAVEEIIAHVRAGFRSRLAANSWMSSATRAEALQKLDQMRFRVGSALYPPPPDGFLVDPTSLAGTVLAAGRAQTAQELARLGHPAIDAQEQLLPQLVSAYYQPFVNVVSIPAGILQPPFYQPGRAAGLNYGGIGGIIGHEIIHGFDDQGRKSDGSGRLRNWWTVTDTAAFADLSERLVKQYEGLEPRPGLRVDGRRTLSENIGDLGGIVAALEGLRLYDAGRRLSPAKTVNSVRDLFIGWARIWRRVYTRKELQRRLLSDNHAPSEFRVNAVLMNLDSFHQAFGIEPGDRMWRRREDRLVIW